MAPFIFLFASTWPRCVIFRKEILCLRCHICVGSSNAELQLFHFYKSDEEHVLFSNPFHLLVVVNRRTWTHIESLVLYRLLFGLSCPVFGLVFELVASWKWLVARGEP